MEGEELRPRLAVTKKKAREKHEPAAAEEEEEDASIFADRDDAHKPSRSGRS
jgi:hypothetical protein